MRKLISFAISLLFFSLSFNAYPQHITAASNKEEILKKAKLEERGGILLLQLSGTPYEMGYQHGVLLKDRIRDIFSNNILGYLTSEEQRR
ncbi:MAG: hypothetical protein AMJ78_06300, partial [Omnitrophica WOR_2 bacterium SM23_29]